MSEFMKALTDILDVMPDEHLDELFNILLCSENAQFDESQYYATEWVPIGGLIVTRSLCKVLDFTEYSISAGDDYLWETRRGEDA